MENLLSKSIEERAINLIMTGVEPLEAVKLAIIEENKLITENENLLNEDNFMNETDSNTLI